MILTPQEYADRFAIHGKRVSARTIKRRCESNTMPSNHQARKMQGKKGIWVIEVKE